MNSHRKNAQWAGVFYIMATVAPIVTIFFTGFLGGGVSEGEPIPDYLAHVAAHESQVIIGMFVELTWALAVVGIIVTLFPILKKQHEALALGFSGFRFLEAISTIVHAIILLSLLTLSQEYAVTGVADAAYYHTAGAVLLAAREWTFLIGSGLIWSLSALMLNYLLYQSKLIPRWLSVWGLIGAALSLGNYVPRFFGIAPMEMLFLPIGVQEMVFAVWLIVKGVKSSALSSQSAKQREAGLHGLINVHKEEYV